MKCEKVRGMKSKLTKILVALSLLFISLPANAFYNPQQGRWLSRDPIGERSEVNLYQFANNSPVQFVDNLGGSPIASLGPNAGEILMGGKYEAGYPSDLPPNSSLPVLQVAIGRRLGYPLKLVTTKGHLFVRWEDSTERFNIEASGNGVNRFSDDYYRHWPLEVSDAEIQAEGYLKSLSPSEELAVFLSIRGMCWRDAHDHKQAAECFRLATKLNPACLSYTIMGGRHAAGD